MFARAEGAASQCRRPPHIDGAQGSIAPISSKNRLRFHIGQIGGW
jgi:hypothetical protein